MIAEEVAAILSVKDAGWSAGFARAEGQLAAFGRRSQTVGAGMSRVGAGMTKGISIPLVALGAGAVIAAKNFESAFAGVKKTVGGTDEEMDTLRTSILNMSKEMPASAEEIAGVAEAAGQLGIPIGEISGFTATMIKMGDSTDMSARDAADAFAHFGNIMGVSGDQMSGTAEKVGNTVVRLGNEFAATESEIMNTAVRMAGAGKTAGLTQSDILGLSTAMADVGVSAELGGTAMSQTFTAMSSAVTSGGVELKQFARVAGVSTAEFSQNFKEDAGTAVLSFVQGLNRIKKGGGDVFKTLDEMGIRGTRQQQTLLSLAGASKKFAAALKVSRDEYSAGSALSDEYAERLKTFDSQLQITANQAKAVGIELGTALLPAMQAMLQAAQPLISVIAGAARAFTSLPGPVQTVAVAIAGIGIAAGPVLWVVGNLVRSFGMLKGGVLILAGGLRAFAGALTGSQAAMIRQNLATNAAAGSNARLFATANAASGAQARVTIATNTAAGSLARYGISGNTAAAVNGRIAATSGGAAAGLTGVGTAAGGAGAASATAAGGLSAIASAMVPIVGAVVGVRYALDMLASKLSEVTGMSKLASGGLANFATDMITMLPGAGGAAEGLLTTLGLIDNRFINMPASYQAGSRAMGEYIDRINQGEGDGRLFAQALQEGKTAEQAFAIATEQAHTATAQQSTAFQQTRLGAMAMAAGLNQTLASIRAQNGGWAATRAQLLQVASAQEQQRNIAVQAAGSNTAAVNQANLAYQRQAVKMGALVPKAQQSGAAFKALAASAGLSAGQLSKAVNGMKRGGQNASQALASALRSGQGKVKNSANNLVNAAQNVVAKASGKLKQSGQKGGKGAGEGLSNAIRSSAGKVKNAAQKMTNGAVQALRSSSGKLKQGGQRGGKGAGEGMASAIKSSAGRVKSAATQLVQGATQAIRSGQGKLKQGGQQAGKGGGDGLKRGMEASKGSVTSGAQAIIEAASSALSGGAGDLAASGSEAGAAGGQGMVDGLSQYTDAAYQAGAALGASATQGYKDNLKVGSPSKVMIRLGENTGQGLIIGMLRKVPAVAAAADRLGASIGAAVAQGNRRSSRRAENDAIDIGRKILNKLKNGLSGGGTTAADVVHDLFKGINTAFRTGFQKLKQQAKEWMQYIKQIQEQVLSAGSFASFDQSQFDAQWQAWDQQRQALAQVAEQALSTWNQDKAAAAEAAAAQRAAAAEAAAVNKKRLAAQQAYAASLRAVQAAQRAVQDADRRGNHYEIAAALDAQVKAQERAVAAAEAAVEAQGNSAEAAKVLADAQKELLAAQKKAAASKKAYETADAATPPGAEPAHGATVANMMKDMQRRANLASNFAANLAKLRGMGLNRQTIQDMIAAGPEAGNILAKALVKGGKGAVGKVNRIQTQLAKAAGTIGDIGGVARYGRTAGQAQAVIDTQINMKNGAITIHYGNPNITPQDRREMRRIVNDAIAETLERMQREARRKRRARQRNK